MENGSMAVTTIPHRPGLTKEELRSIFARHFDGKYTIADWSGMPRGMRDFMVVKSGFVAVTVKLEQTPTETKIVYSGFTPKLWARALVGGIGSMLLWNGLTGEVKQLIETAPEFH
jgi:hypothetical protein